MEERARHLMLMKVNLGSATNALCNNRTFRHHHHLSSPQSGLRAARKARQGKSRQGRVQEGISKGAQIKAQENHVRGEIVMSPRRAKCSSTSLGGGHGRLACSILYGLKHRAQSRCRKEFSKWPVRLLWLAANGPRPPFRERRTVVGER